MSHAYPELKGKSVFLQSYLQERGWDTYIEQLNLKLRVDNFNPILSLATRFELSRADLGLALVENQRTLDSIFKSIHAVQRLVVIKRNTIERSPVNESIEDSSLISVWMKGLDIDELAHAFIQALAR